MRPERPAAQRLRLERAPATIVLVLVTVGLVTVYSASSGSALLERQNPLGLVAQQLVFALLGLAVYAAATRMRFAVLRRLSTPALGVALFALLLVLVPGIGKTVNGARRWIDLGIVQIQPSEFAKLALILWMADMLSRPERRRPDIGPVMLGVGITTLLVLLGPDLGTAMIVAVTAVAMLGVAGVPRRVLVRLGAVAVSASAIVAVSVPYMQTRIVAFLDPWADPQGQGFQAVHAQMAVATGGIFGVGPGNGIQKLSYLPEAHTDMIAATIAEEFGLVGFAVLIGLFVALAIAGFRVAAAARNPHQRLLAAGITWLIVTQAGINLAAMLGLMPVTGVPLPLISYGGSSLVVSLAASGILVNIGRTASRSSGAFAAAARRDRGRGNRGTRDAGARGGRRPATAWR